MHVCMYIQADAEYDASLARALEHKDKLLEYERTSARRTVIYGTHLSPPSPSPSLIGGLDRAVCSSVVCVVCPRVLSRVDS